MNTRLEPDDEQVDVLENAIRALRETSVPSAPLADLKEAVLDELADYCNNPVSARRKRTRRLAAWGALATAACVSGFIFVGQFRTVHDGEVRRAYDPPLPQQQHVSSSVTIRWTPFPTLWEYYRAAQRSPDDLEAFLGEHADRMPPAAPEPFRIGMFSVLEEETL